MSAPSSDDEGNDELDIVGGAAASPAVGASSGQDAGAEDGGGIDDDLLLGASARVPVLASHGVETVGSGRRAQGEAQ